MSLHIVELIKALIPHIRTQQERDEAYLNESIDNCDVERRMYEIDHRPRDNSWQNPVFIYKLH